MQGKLLSEYSSHIVPGDYWQDNGVWYGMTPNGLIANLANHTVIYNPNDTITVTPSIAVNNGEGGVSWHGFLELGVWREC